jgi:hypothetical protein
MAFNKMAYYTVYSSTQALNLRPHYKAVVVNPFYYQGMTRLIIHNPSMTIYEHGDKPTNTKTNLLIFNPTVSYEDIVYEVYLLIQNQFKEICQEPLVMNIDNYKAVIYFNGHIASNEQIYDVYYSNNDYTLFRTFERSGFIMYHSPKLYKQSVEGLKERLIKHGNIPEIMYDEAVMVHCLRQAYLHGDVPQPFYEHMNDYITTYYTTL